MTKIVAISDTHNQHKGIVVPDGDILVHPGDFTGSGTIREVGAFLEWFKALPHKNKILVAGNHDWLFERQPALAREMCKDAGIIYLNEEEANVEGLTFFGSPYQPEFCDWAFNAPRGEKLNEHWEKIPANLDVLITHGPPYGILDKTPMTGEPVGCKDLLNHVKRVKPLVHIFGHIHSAHGVLERDGTKFVNASQLDDDYRRVYKPIVIEV